MGYLVLGLLLFVGVHQLPLHRTVRTRLLKRMGESGYKGMVALVALSGLGLLIYGKSVAPFVHLYLPYPPLRHLSMLLLLLAMVLLLASILPCNLRRWVKHPQLLSVALWGGAHLMTNGDLSSLILFGGLALFALHAIWRINRRLDTSKALKLSWARDLLVLGVGVLLYGLIVWFHGDLFGVPLLPA